MKKQLVILTIDFPDPLFEKELPFLARTFDRIYILPAYLKPTNKITVPRNVFLHALFKQVDFRDARRLIWKHLFRIIRIYGWTLLQPGNFKLYVRHYRSFLGHLITELERIKPLEDFIRAEKLNDALFYDYWLVDTTIALAELKRKNVIKNTIARTHGFDLYDERQFEQRVPFREYRIHHLDAVYAISNHGYEYLKNKVSPALFKKIHLRRLGITNHQHLQQTKTSSGFTIVSCANLIPLKRIGLLADVLKHSTLPIHWIHFGEGSQRAAIERKIKSLPANIIADFRGETSNAEVLKFYADHYIDLFISLSESEGLPVSMMEAISSGIPIFACGINGVPEIVTEVTGKLIPVDLPAEEIRLRLEEVLTIQHFDRKAIQAFFVANFDAQTNCESFVRHINVLFDTNLVLSTSPSGYQQCAHCVLDSNDDPAITFDDFGVCSYCRKYEENEKLLVKKGDEGKRELDRIVGLIKESGKHKPYDCILGISGGVDSTYLAYQAKQLGLRPLCVHFDNGWNSELATKNIENLVSKLGFDLHTFVVDWEEFKDLQLAFFKASVIDIELPTDHAMLATLYTLALDHKIEYVLSGHNIVTESVLPESWYFNKRDSIHIEAISQRFGTIPLKTFPLLTPSLKFRVEWERIKSVGLLNLMPYNKAEVKKFITKEIGWRDYGGKHYESIFTRFYQGYVLVKKFGVDKRKAHLSNLICSGQITREEAIEELKKSPYDPSVLASDYDFVLKKLELTREAFESIMALPVKKHTDYPFGDSVYDHSSFLKFFGPAWRVFKKVRAKVLTSKN
jgi:N-acetyl sugar amidotransferase